MSEVATTKEVNLGEGSVAKLMVSMAIPAITAQIINVLYNMVDRMYIGHIKDVGPTALTGLGIALPIIMIISAFAALIGYGGAPRAAIAMGRGDNADAEKTLGNCFSSLLLISLILTIFFQIFAEKILILFGASSATLPYAKEYMVIYTLGTVCVQIALGLNSFITTQGFAKISMMTVLIGAVTNIILDPIFIFGFGMGVTGAALATIIAQGISAIWVLRFLTSSKTNLRIRKKNLIIRPKVILPVLALGISPFIMQSTESLLLICFNTSLARYGTDLTVGAMTILSTVMQFTMLPVLGLSQGAQPLISFNFGAKKPKRVKKAFQLFLIAALCYTAAMWSISMFAPQLFASLFTSNAELIAITSWAMRIYMFGMLVFGAQMACQQTFIALGNAKASLFLALLRKIILLIPLIYILPHIMVNNQVKAVFLAEPIADFIAVITTVLLFTVQFKKTLKTIEN